MSALVFRPLRVEDAPKVKSWLAETPQESSDMTLSYLLPISDNGRENLEVADVAGCGIFRLNTIFGRAIHYPIGGGDRKAALIAAMEAASAANVRFNVEAASESQVAEFKEWFPEGFNFSENTEEADYIYRTEDLANLAGRKYEAKRRMIRRFTDDGAWTYSDITCEADIADCRKVLAAWSAVKAAEEDTVIYGTAADARATSLSLDNFFTLGYLGGIVRRGNEPVVFSLGERMTKDMLMVSYEKAIPDCRGAYAVINREFIRSVAVTGGYTFANRTCDLGFENLRHAKMLYHPVRFVRKFDITGAGR